MTFDRWMKLLLSWELQAFPNAVYHSDCWYAFTPLGLMYQVFVLRDRSGFVSLEYSASPLIAPLVAEPGNSMKKLIFGRPKYRAFHEHARLHPEKEYGAHSIEYYFRTGQAQQPEHEALLRLVCKEVIVPYFRRIQTIQDLYDSCCAVTEEGEKDLWLTLRHGDGGYVFSYLHRQQEGLSALYRMREACIARSRASFAEWLAKGYKEEDLNIQTILERNRTAYDTEEQLLLLPDSVQQQRLREIFDENCSKINEMLHITPHFDLDSIFPAQ